MHAVPRDWPDSGYMIAIDAETAEILAKAPEACRAAAAVLRPPEDLRPSEFAARYRYLKEGTTFKPGRWSNEVFPYLVAIMDAIEEAILLGKRGVVLMKSGQGGGSEAMINALLWLKTMYSGPLLYLISKDDLAKEFSRDRFDHANKTCPPVAAKALTGYGSGDSLHQKRYVDGKLTICGGRSMLNLQSEPRRFVMIDEVDSLLDEVPDGDPLKIAEIRVDAFPGETLIVAFAHPTTEDRGAGKLYYTLSDQRRGFVACPPCDDEFWLSWKHVAVEPHAGQSAAQAERDPSAYVYRTPCCGEELTDALRWAAVANGCTQASTLDPDVAARKSWIGVHFSQLYMSNKSLAFLAEKHIEGLDDPPTARVVVNKRMGDVYRESKDDADWRAWDQLRGDYDRGEVPDWASFLTSGEDFNARWIHYAIWAWGLRVNSSAQRVLCGALVDYDEIERPRGPDGSWPAKLDVADLSILDQHVLERRFRRGDGTLLRPRASYADSGWQPNAVYEYCRTRRNGFTPIKGGAEDDRSKAPEVRWGKVPPYLVDGNLVDADLRLGTLNTFKAKGSLFGLVGARMELVDTRTGELTPNVPRLLVPADVDTAYLQQAGSERKKRDGRKTVWVNRGPNHWSDCNVYAWVAARNIAILQRGRTSEELKHQQQRRKRTKRKRVKRRVRREY